jgi:phytoene dehydrogenase-like protein
MGELSALGLLFTIAGLHEKICGYVIGGSMRLSNALEKRYLDLGGTIDYSSRVKKILTKDDKAVGIRLADGVEHQADYVISAADGHSTIFDMLNGAYINDAISNYYQNMPIFPPLIYVGLGVNMTFADEPQLVTGFFFELDNPIVIGGKERRWINVRIANYDPTLAPPGKTTLTSMFFSNYEYWRDLSSDHDKYEAEKESIASLIIEHLDDRFPGLASAVEMKDVATPLTFKRYTGNWQGSFEGWLMTPENFNMRIPKTLPGLDSFYMAGQWVQPGGGLPGGVNSGREVIQLICRNDGRTFTTTMP